MKTFINLFFLLPLINSQGVSDCFLPTGKPGICAPLGQCTHLTDLIGNLQKPLPRDVSLLLRESFFCNNQGQGITVCCPGDGLTVKTKVEGENRGECGLQDGMSAECVSYLQCSPFVQLMANLRKPLPSSSPRLIQSSYLCGVDTVGEEPLPKVCCPSQAIKKPEPEVTATTLTPPTTTDRFANYPGRSLLANSASCGISLSSEKRIVGGQNADLGQYPWLVNLGYRQNGGSNNLFKCGGTLIGKRHVITAAHCVTQLPKGFDLSVVRVGEYDLSMDVDCDSDNFCSPPPQDMQVEEVYSHESYGKPASFQNDIAIIKLKKEVEINDFVSPICLPYTHDKEDYLSKRINTDNGELELQIEVAGWGATNKVGRDPANILQFLDVNI
ncbi:melanization protease 1 isoform X2 [Eurytemora carolleeae]|uniref:melanization protease 1 isoform X2 n=1 Tax=Eurytemora carolleeae TaxID=1294199 RepID=UPI000C77A7DC|nr:melanization protease 1 isoform X2 [Eurytemora carolleeae]|eukprot:XP_023332008.1 melanization protease 1-like isoform X2 [Eurytemora affinis]